MSMRILEELERINEKTEGSQILWEMARSLWKNITYEEFEEGLKEDGYEDYYCRVLIGLQDLDWMKQTFGGDGKGLMRKRYKQLLSGELDEKENRKLRQLRKLKKTYDRFLEKQKRYEQQEDK